MTSHSEIVPVVAPNKFHPIPDLLFFTEVIVIIMIIIMENVLKVVWMFAPQK